MNMFQLFII